MSKENYQKRSIEQLEELISGLPRREPKAELRERVLANAITMVPQNRKTRSSLFAAAALAFLMIADFLVVSYQDSTISFNSTSTTKVVQAQPLTKDEAEFMHELAEAGLPVRFAMLRTDKSPESYFEIRDRALKEMNGGS